MLKIVLDMRLGMKDPSYVYWLWSFRCNNFFIFCLSKSFVSSVHPHLLPDGLKKGQLTHWTVLIKVWRCKLIFKRCSVNSNKILNGRSLMPFLNKKSMLFAVFLSFFYACLFPYLRVTIYQVMKFLIIAQKMWN